MADLWWNNGMRTDWRRCWIFLLTVLHMTRTATQRASITQTPSPEPQPQMKSMMEKNITLHELVGRYGARVYPLPAKDLTTRLPEFLPDGPRPFVPEPNFMPGSTDVVVHQSEMAVLPCAVQNLGARQVSWNKSGGDHFLSIGTEIWVQNSNLDIAHYSWPAGVSDWNLVFKETRPEDSGLYECKVISTEKMIWRVRLTVLDKPPHKPVISIEGKEFVESGQKLYLKCNTTEGDKIPEDVDWFKDGDKIEAREYPHIFITKYRSKDTMALVSELTIISGTSNDSGTYICRSTSELIASAEVNVLVADSSNVKRGTSISRKRTENGKNEGHATTYFQHTGRNLRLICLILLAYFTANGVVT